MDTNTKFIYTVSRESADILTNEGFTLVFIGSGFWVFLNDKHFNFDKLKYITFSDKIYG